jgi:PelA/Pel-15E family pectate lyase
MQYKSGGFPQVYPVANVSNYHKHATFNDNAMVRVLVLLDRIEKKIAPFDTDVVTDTQRANAALANNLAVDFILKAQIVQNNVKTVWCAQHDALTYAPADARAYEFASKSGSESTSVVMFLMSRPQTPAVVSAIKSAIAWFNSPNVRVLDKAYVNRPSGSTDDTYNPIQTKAGSIMWYRFYDLEADTGFFSGRPVADGGMGKQYDIMKIEPERRYGYSWGGAYASKLLSYATSVGYN